jgi:hypothetical protein
MKIAHINENNQLLGWYSTDIHKEIPTPNIEVTEEQWQIAIDNGHNKVNKDGTTELFDFRTAEEIAEADKQAQIVQSKAYLNETEFKFNDDYDQKDTQEWLEIKAKRQEARELIRSLEN